MKLYYSKGACSLAVRIVLHELQLPCEFEAVNLKTKQTVNGENFLTINPKGEVPTLLLDSQEILTENVVIQQYLADQQQAFDLLPAITDFNRYRVLEWLNFISTDIHKGFGPLFNSHIPEEIKTRIFIPLLENKLNYINEHLQSHTWLMGDTFTLPDAYLCVIILWLSHFDFEKEKWENLSRYTAALKERPSVKQACEEEGLLLK